MDKEIKREKIIKRLMRQSNMSRESAAFAADVELGNLCPAILLPRQKRSRKSRGKRMNSVATQMN